MDALERSTIIEQYRKVRCELLIDGEWSSAVTPPTEPMFLMSAWNPGRRETSEADNHRHDARLYARLLHHGLQPQRFRGRGSAGTEFGWMFPHDQQRSLDLLAEFGQLAGVVWTPRGRSLLWSEGMFSPIDSDRCEIPDEDPA